MRPYYCPSKTLQVMSCGWTVIRVITLERKKRLTSEGDDVTRSAFFFFFRASFFRGGLGALTVCDNA